MTVVYQVQMSKVIAPTKKNVVITSLLSVEPITIKNVNELDVFRYWFAEFVKTVKEKIGYIEALSFAQFAPVVCVSMEYESPKGEERNSHYMMETLLMSVYGSTSQQLSEAAEDLFIVLSQKWLEAYKKDTKLT